MSIFTHCFPHSGSFNIYYSDSENKDREIFDLNVLTETIYYGVILTNGATRKLGHYLLMTMWRLILKSPMLFRIRDEHVEDAKLLERFCGKRVDDFAKELCYENHLFDDANVELFDELNVWASMEETEECQSGKRIKLNEKKFTLLNYFATLTRKYMFGELSRYMMADIQKFITKQNTIPLTFKIEKLRDMVLKYFEYTSSILPLEDQDVTLYFIGMAALLEYLAADIIELGGIESKDFNMDFIIESYIERQIFRDLELKRTVLFHLNNLPLVDFNYFYGANQQLLPSIDVNEKITMEEYNFTQIPTELHYLILKNFSSLEEILEMRLVCKLWNHFIVNDNDIWKNLICNNMISEEIFRFCDSTFNVNELETILGRGKYQNPLPFQQQVINYFYERKDWKSLYFILVRSHLTFIKDLDLVEKRDLFEEYFSSHPEEHYENTKKSLQIGITKCKLFDYSLAKQTPNRPLSQSSTIYIPKDAIFEFKMIGNRYDLVGIVDFTKFSSYISCRLFPQNGLLYCFYNFDSARSEFLYFENYLESESLIPFEISEQTFQYAIPVYKYQVFNEQIVANQPSNCSLFYLQHMDGLKSSCTLAPCLLFSNSKELTRDMNQSYQKDNIVLHSESFTNDNAVSVYISREDLILRRFSNSKIECYNTIESILNLEENKVYINF